MSRYRKLTTICAAAMLALGLAACGGGGSDNTPVSTAPPTEPPPAEPAPPTDLEETQTAAAAAAAAAMTASTSADAAADGAEAATANIATLQTNGMAADLAMAARAAADAAMAAAGDAGTASAAAAAATTGDAAEEAWADARAAKMSAETAATTAAEKASAAIEAAVTELHIDGTVNTVGSSSVDTDAPTSTSQDDGTMTGFIKSVSRAVDTVAGVPFDQRGVSAASFTSDGIQYDDDTTTNAKDVAYVQAVKAGSAKIGKVLDTSDDAARLTIVTAREGKKSVRVFADRAENNTAGGLLTDAGLLVADLDDTTPGNQTAAVKSIGSFHVAEHSTGEDNNALDAADVVDPASDPVELFELTGTVGGAAQKTYARVEKTETDHDAGTTTVTYRAVDIMAVAAPDVIADGNDNPEEAQVRASLPTADAYDHIHFGVWAGLTDKKDGDNSVIAGLGIGFVQNYDGSGVTTGHVTGTATYSGDWVAVVRQMHSTSHSVEDGHATMTANFSTDEFTGELDGLATLTGSLSGNTFSGTKASVSHEDLDTLGTFAGSFSGAVYGPDGSEAAGVFSFDGGDAGAFTGAFGGRDDDQ